MPPGACCPICGSAIRIIYSRKQIDRALYAIKKNMDLLPLKGILRALQGLIKVSHCRLSGYSTIESDLFVIVDTTELDPSPLQLDACKQEVQKIATLIDTQSHRITSSLALSSLTVANVVHSQRFDDDDVNDINTANYMKLDNLIMLITTIVLLFRMHFYLNLNVYRIP